MESDDEVVEVAYATFPRRLMAMSLDVLVMVGIIVGGAVLMTFLPAFEGAILAVAIGAAFMYEPLMVSQRAGTLGHYAMNLRVYREDTEEKLSLLAALGRMWLKMFLGLLSFFVMVLTRRYQSLHDVATKSVVVVHDLSKARPFHYHVERDIAPGANVSVSVPRRLAVIAGYGAIIFVISSIAGAAVLSQNCIMSNLCSARDETLSSLIGAGLILGWGAIAVLGWLGKLPGARETVRRSTSEVNGA